MTTRRIFAATKTQPLKLFAIVLGSVFTVEAAVMLVLPFVVPSDSGITFTAVLDSGLLTVVVAPLLWWLIVRPLQQLADFRHRMLALVLSAQEDERRRIARDLHDGLGQTLTSLLLGLRTIEETSSDQNVQASARDLRLIGAGAHDEVRRLARGLRPAVLDDVGLTPALERFLDDLRSSQDIEIELKHDGIAQTRLSPEVETALYRISQEAIANSIRHGAASRIDLTLHCRSKYVELSISDNGVGFCPSEVLSEERHERPFGLLSIYERARLLGGNAWIDSSAGAGTHLRVQLPLRGLDSINGEDSSSPG